MRPRGLTRALVAAGIIASVAWVLHDAGLLDPERVRRGWRNAGIFLADMVPPASDASLVATLADALLVTVRMAWAGTVLGAVAALPLAVLAAQPLSHALVARIVRAILAALRTIPSILWALFFVAIVGLGEPAGILAIAFYTAGFLGKLFYESLEAIEPEVLDAARATGATRFQVARHAAIPEMGNALLSQSLFAFEYNVRASSIIGLVGAGGIGLYLLDFVNLFQYQRLATALIMLFAVVLAVDGTSRLVRRRFLDDRAA